MNICLLTDDEKSDIFRETRKYTKDDLLQLSILASANETYTKILFSYCSDTGNKGKDDGSLIDLMNILTWLAEPLNAFFCEVGLWGNIPPFLKKKLSSKEPEPEKEPKENEG